MPVSGQARGVCVALSVMAWALGAAKAGEIVDHATSAEALIAADKPVQALAEVEAAFNLAWEKAPLGFSEALFVSSRPQGFGMYEERPTAVFAPDEDMFVYAEPFGYGYAENAGQFTIGFEADFELRTTKGQILHAQEGFATPGLTTRRRNKEFQVFITYNFKGLKPGEYVLVTRLRDRNSDKAGSFELPFSIQAP